MMHPFEFGQPDSEHGAYTDLSAASEELLQGLSQQTSARIGRRGAIGFAVGIGVVFSVGVAAGLAILARRINKTVDPESHELTDPSPAPETPRKTDVPAARPTLAPTRGAAFTNPKPPPQHEDVIMVHQATDVTGTYSGVHSEEELWLIVDRSSDPGSYRQGHLHKYADGTFTGRMTLGKGDASDATAVFTVSIAAVPIGVSGSWEAEYRAGLRKDPHFYLPPRRLSPAEAEYLTHIRCRIDPRDATFSSKPPTGSPTPTSSPAASPNTQPLPPTTSEGSSHH